VYNRKVMIFIEINNTKAKLTGNIPKAVYKEIDLQCSYIHQGAKFISKYGKTGWDGVVRLFKYNAIPTGLVPRVLGIIKKSNTPYKIKDLRTKVNYGDQLEIDPNCFFKPREYQTKAVERCIKRGSGVVKIATGGGKTGTLSMLVGHYNIKTIIYVIGVELLYQMKETIETLYPELEVGIIGDGKCDVKKVNIATIWSAAAAFNKKIDMFDSDVTYDKNSNKDINKELVRKTINEAELFILDECQYAAANTVQFLHRESKAARHRFLFSASPWRDSGDDILIEAVGGPKIYDLPASTLIDAGFLVKPSINFVNVPPMKSVGTKYQEVYKNYIVENDVRNDLIKKSAMKLVAQGKKVLILVVRVNHGKKICEVLGDDLRVDYLDGKKSTSQRLQAIQDMKDGFTDVLVASKIFDQGVDIPELDALILAGSGKSTGRALQRIGRVIRKFPGKEKAIVVEFMDNCKYLKNHSDVRMEVYKTEPSFEIKELNKKARKKFTKRKPIQWS
jgi:superfamily II DNA or RNA helicase